MSVEQSGPSRRALLVAALLPLAGCDAGDRSTPEASPTPRRRSAGPTTSPYFAALERKHGAHLGVYALALRPFRIRHPPKDALVAEATAQLVSALT
jgi:beta-lactamase class A